MPRKPSKAPKKKRETPHDFGMDPRGEFDEVFVSNAFVHIERMNETGFWIGIDAPGKPRLMVNTGVYRGQWFFTVQVDDIDGQFFRVERPRRPLGRANLPPKAAALGEAATKQAAGSTRSAK